MKIHSNSLKYIENSLPCKPVTYRHFYVIVWTRTNSTTCRPHQHWRHTDL